MFGIPITRINVVTPKNQPSHYPWHGAYDKMHPSHLGVPNFINHQPFFSAKSGFTTAKSLPNSAKTSTATPAVLTAVALRPNPSAGRWHQRNRHSVRRLRSASRKKPGVEKDELIHLKVPWCAHLCTLNMDNENHPANHTFLTGNNKIFIA